MKQPERKEKTAAMLNIDRDIHSIDDKVRALQVRKRELRNEWLELREKEWGLVGGETMIRELPEGLVKRKGRVGQFERFYSKYHDSSSWVIVRQVNKDGKVGLRKTTFFNWEKEAA